MKKGLFITIILAGLIYGQTHNTIHLIRQVADSLGWYWRMWHVNASGQVINSHTVDKNTPLTTESWNAGPPPYALWAYNVANWPAPAWQSGDRIITQTDRDSTYGTKGHKGFYAIVNDTLAGNQNPQYLLDDTLRSIPRPMPISSDSLHNDTAFISLPVVNLVWPKPKQTTGSPVINNIIGYAIYRDTAGIGRDDTLAAGNPQYFSLRKIVTDTVGTDTVTNLDFHLLYYAIKLVYRPDTVPKLTSKFLSRNSVGIYKTPPIGVMEQQSSDYGSIKLLLTPNPFKNALEIKLETNQNSGLVTIGIYDLAGKLVQQFKLSDHSTRSSSVLVWNGTDASGALLPSGVYFIRATNGNVNLIKKAILQR